MSEGVVANRCGTRYTIGYEVELGEIVPLSQNTEFRNTGFRGTSREPEDIGFCEATGFLKLGSVYRQGWNYHLQVFLKECIYKEKDVIFKSLLSDDDDGGYDTVYRGGR